MIISIRFENETPFTIAGVFKDIPPNSHLEGEILMPMQNLIDIYGLYYGFGGGDSYLGYVRLAPGTDPEVINEKLPSIWPKYWDVEKYEESGFIQRYYIAPIKDVHSGIKQIKQIVTLLGILGFAILLITTFNYVLLAISGLNRRAKGVGVHKFCGASSARIFKLFAYETGILLLFSLFLITLITLALKSNLPPFTHFVNFTNIMIIISVILLIFVIATAIPGLLFASIPAKQIYQKVIGSKKGWKKTLLLVQFSGIAFIVNILIIVFMQYRYSNTIDTGYEMDKIAMIELSALELQSEEEQLLQIETLKQELARLPFVEKVAEAGLSPLDGYSGESIVDTNDNLIFISRMAEIDADYMETLGYELIAGDFANKNGEIVVNEEFVKKMGWKDSPIGKEIRWQGKITGVVKNSISSVYHDIQPILFVIEEGGMSIFVSLTEMTPGNMAQLNELVQRLFPESGDEFVWLKSEYTSQHRTIAMIGVLISLAIIILMIITLMGLFGFIADEVRRRNKEIAIRKVFGADSSNIIQLITKSLLDVTLLSLLIGGVAAFFVGRLILQLIAMKIALTPLIFILGSIIVFMIIFLTSRIKTKQMLKRNPVESLQSNE